MPPEYMAYRDRKLEFVKHEGNTAVVKFLHDRKNIPMQYLLPMHPDMERLLVTPMRGELTGKIYRVLSYEPMRCKIRDITIKPVRKKDDFFMPTDELVNVYSQII